ncbi:MAG: hypothetical protein JSU96_13035 [Acidobacteriota bacterium]|nr:MAG: hypothetical protein JSU96_13035 [Acidobacteriota bacterium]
MKMKWFLALVLAFFMAFLVLLYIVSEKANPILLDEQGRPINAPIEETP